VFTTKKVFLKKLLLFHFIIVAKKSGLRRGKSGEMKKKNIFVSKLFRFIGPISSSSMRSRRKFRYIKCDTIAKYCEDGKIASNYIAKV